MQIQAGLCTVCAHVKVIHNRRGSSFFLCERSRVDPSFRRYPPLPVLRCRGFEPGEGAEGGETGAEGGAGSDQGSGAG